MSRRQRAVPSCYTAENTGPYLQEGTNQKQTPPISDWLVTYSSRAVTSRNCEFYSTHISTPRGTSPVPSGASAAPWKLVLASFRHLAQSFCKLCVSVYVSHVYSFCGTRTVNLGIATAISQSNRTPCCVTTAVIAGSTTHHILAIVSITHN